jgi:serine/threonine protein kinase
MKNAFMNYHNNTSENSEKYKMRRASKIEKINKYSITKLLYKNSVLAVYRGLHTVTNETIIIKCQTTDFNSEKYKGIIEHEKKILEQIKDVSGVPKIIDFKNDMFSKSLIINYLGNDLESLINNKKNFSIGLCAFIMSETITILKNIHKYNVLHCDIKPSNLIYNSKENKIYLIDFSVAQTKASNNKYMIGTPKFCSYYCHEYIPYSCRDDLISLGYVLIYFYYGYLPWQKKKLCASNKNYNFNNIKEEKGNIMTFFKINKTPEEFIIYFNYCFSLNEKDDIDYNMIHLLFVRLLKTINYTKEDLISETNINDDDEPDVNAV